MNHKPFLYSAICAILYGFFLHYEKPDWKTAKSIVTKVKVNDTVINNVNGLEISEIQSNADVIYKIDDNIHTYHGAISTIRVIMGYFRRK